MHLSEAICVVLMNMRSISGQCVGHMDGPQFYAGSVELVVKWQLKQSGLHHLRGPSRREFYEA